MRLRAPDPHPDPLAAHVAAELDTRLDAASPAPVALALSGGGDSLALLHLMAPWCARVGRPLLALTVDHRLHPDSGAWTTAAGHAAQAAGAEWRSLVWGGPKPATGLAAAARAARHRLLAEAAREAGACVILMAHTANDALEADRMRADTPGLGRLRAWGPSPVWPQGRCVALLRPLLQVRRAELRAWLTARGLGWIDDPANADLSHPRIRARRALAVASAAPAQPSAAPALPDLAACDGWGIVRLERAALAALDGQDAMRTLGRAAAVASGGEAPARSRALGGMAERLRAGGPADGVLGGARLLADEREVRLGRERGRRPPPELQLAGHAQVWDGRFAVRADEDGWRAGPLAGHVARLSRMDRARLRQVPAPLRPALPVFLRGGEARLADGDRLAAEALGPLRLDLACGRIAGERALAARTSPSS